MSVVLAVDVGGSGVRAGVSAPDGGLGPVFRNALDPGWHEDRLWSEILQCARLAASGRAISAVGLSFPAFLDTEGRALHVVNLPALEGVPLSARLSEDFDGATAFALPDLAATVIAEARLGAGRGYRRVLCTALGTGVNAGLAVDGDVLDVALGCLGDAGHVNVDLHGPRCSCGGLGCLEAICSGAALRVEAQRLGWNGVEHLARAACEGHARAVAIIARAGAALGRAIATWSAILAPDAVVIAGNVAQIGGPLLASARSEARRVGVPYLVRDLPVLSARFGGDAALVGAGLAAAERCRPSTDVKRVAFAPLRPGEPG